MARDHGDYDRSVTLFEESLALGRELGHKSGVADGLCNLGEVLTSQGEYAGAYPLHAESLKIRQELGDRWGYAFSLEGFARLAYRQGQAARASRLYGAAEALRQAISCPLSPADQEKQVLIAADLRARLGDADFEAAWSQGRAMPPEEALAFALDASAQPEPGKS